MDQVGPDRAQRVVVDTELLLATRHDIQNADIRSRDLARVCMMDSAAEDELRRNLEKLNLSARAYDRVLRVARTIADLRGSEAVGQEDIMEAVGYRQLDDRSGFMA